MREDVRASAAGTLTLRDAEIRRLTHCNQQLASVICTVVRDFSVSRVCFLCWRFFSILAVGNFGILWLGTGLELSGRATLVQLLPIKDIILKLKIYITEVLRMLIP